jgi:hypothetical protein
MDLKKLLKQFLKAKKRPKDQNKKWVNGVVGGPPSAANRALQ